VQRAPGKRVCLDGDLTGIPVSNTNQAYPHAAFGRMDDAIWLGYQASVVSLESPMYGRLWLSVAHHSGDIVSCTQAVKQAKQWRAPAEPQGQQHQQTELARLSQRLLCAQGAGR
jgi:hypothetical protein